MKLRIVSTILMVVTILISLLPFLQLAAAEAFKTSLSVHNIDTGKDFATIQEAIDDPETLDGHTILVDSGIYYEHITIDKSILLVGEDKHSTIIESNSERAVVAIKADNVYVTNFTIRNSEPGAFDSLGVRMENCSGSILSNNVIKDNTMGIRLDNSSDNTITDNEVFLRPLGSILFASSDGNTFTNNTVRDGYMGIFLVYSSHNLFNQNKIHSNYFGIRTADSSDNTIVANDISNNRWGVYIAQYHESGGNNLVYHNNFVNNSDFQAREWNSTNRWDNGYPFGGNYWSNYTGVDLYSGVHQNETGSDGVGDTSYPVLHEYNLTHYDHNRDSYPLMEPWSPPTMTKTLIRTIHFWSLNLGIENSFIAKLESVLHYLETGKENLAVHKLMAFINQVQALSGTKLTEEQADHLTSEAEKIMDLIKK